MTHAPALTVLKQLRSFPSWTVDELALKVGCDRKTLLKHLDLLRKLGFAIEHDKTSAASGGGLVSLHDSDVLPPLSLTDEERVACAAALTIATAAVHQLETPALEDAAFSALNKVRSLRPLIERRVLPELASELPFGPASVIPTAELEQCLQGIRRRRTLRFRFTDKNGYTSHRHVEPHAVTPGHGGWLLLAFDLDKHDWRTFSVSGMEQLESGTPFTPRPKATFGVGPAPFGAPPLWLHQLHVVLDAPLEEVLVKHPKLASMLQSGSNDTTVLIAGTNDPQAALMTLARLGMPFRVLGGAELAAEGEALIERIRAAFPAAAEG